MRQPPQINFILRQPFADLAHQLREDFKGNPNVKIILDRRIGERRTRQKPVPVEWRRRDRRGSEQLMSVVIGTITQIVQPR